MIDEIYVYDISNVHGRVVVKALSGLFDHLIKYDFTYKNDTFSGGAKFENVVFLKIGCYNNCDDILVYVQFNIITGGLRTILLYDKSKFSINYIIDIAADIQRELLKINIFDKYGSILNSFYDTQIGEGSNTKNLDNLNDIDDEDHLDNLMGDLMDANVHLYNTYIKSLELEDEIRNLGLVPNSLLRKYMDIYIKNNPDKNVVNTRLKYRTDFSSVINLPGGKSLYPQILEEVGQKIKLNNFIPYHI